MDKIWIFDLDDTLIPNQHCYDYAILKLVEWLIPTIGYRCPNTQNIVNLLVSIDYAEVKTSGFGMERFPTSCAKTYEEICKTLEIPINEECSKTAYEIGLFAYDYTLLEANGLLPGAIKLLDFLKSNKDVLILLTKGDRELQNKKININNLKKYFDEIYIVDNKTVAQIETIIYEYGYRETYSVGNSIKSDIIPSLEAGCKVIYIPCETWQFEREHNGLPEHQNLIKIDKLTDIIEMYGKL